MVEHMVVHKLQDSYWIFQIAFLVNISCQMSGFILFFEKYQHRTKEKVTRIIFRQSQVLWTFNHSRKI